APDRIALRPNPTSPPPRQPPATQDAAPSCIAPDPGKVRALETSPFLRRLSQNVRLRRGIGRAQAGNWWYFSVLRPWLNVAGSVMCFLLCLSPVKGRSKISDIMEVN